MRQQFASVRQLIELQKENALSPAQIEKYRKFMLQGSFYIELAAALPSAIDRFIEAGEHESGMLAAALQTMAAHYVQWGTDETRATMVREHGLSRLRNLRYAPLLQESKRPLALYWLLQMGKEADMALSRKPLDVRVVAPPAFMGPPDSPPTGAALAAPLELSQPHARHSRIVRPHAMEPPAGAPTGGMCRPPPTPATYFQPVGGHMAGLQQLATMCQLLRSVAATTRDVQQADLLAGSVGGVAQLLMRDRWRNSGMLGKERVGGKDHARQKTRRKLPEALRDKSRRNLKRMKEHTRHRTRKKEITQGQS